MQSTGAHSTAMPQQDSAPSTDAAAATLTPARYMRHGSRAVGHAPSRGEGDPAALRRLCTKLANNAAARLGGAIGTGVHHRGAAPGSANVCTRKALIRRGDLADAGSVGHTRNRRLIQQMESSRVRSEWMSALYKWSGTLTRQNTALSIKIEEE